MVKTKTKPTTKPARKKMAPVVPKAGFKSGTRYSCGGRLKRK